LGTITVLSDITYLKDINQRQSDFVSMVTHEIRSPLNSVMAQIKVVRDGLTGDVTQKQNEILGRASEKINSLVSLSSELLNMASREAGLIALERTECDMTEVIKDQVDFHQPKAQAKGIQLKLDPLPDLPPVLANKQNMEDVLSNLITNAINYTPGKGTISISAFPGKHHLCISISDTGVYKESCDTLDKSVFCSCFVIFFAFKLRCFYIFQRRVILKWRIKMSWLSVVERRALPRRLNSPI
jgi:signal transduction histidine kinase